MARSFPEIHVIERTDPKADSYAAELNQVQAHLNAEAGRVLELKDEVHTTKSQLQTEKHMVRALEAELLKERRTINELLDQMQAIELEARAAEEQARLRDKVAQDEKEALQKELDDERAMRLQHMYMITRSRAEADKAAKDVEILNKTILVTQEEQRATVAEIESLQAALRASKRVAEEHERQVRATTTVNLTHKEDSHYLRSRLVEADKEITYWRKKFEESQVAAAKDRAVFGKMVRRSTKKSSETRPDSMPPVRSAAKSSSQQATRSSATPPMTSSEMIVMLKRNNNTSATALQSRDDAPGLWPPWSVN